LLDRGRQIGGLCDGTAEGEKAGERESGETGRVHKDPDVERD